MSKGKITIHGATQPLDKALPPILVPMNYEGEAGSLFVRGEAGAPFNYDLMRSDATRPRHEFAFVGVAKVQARCGTIGGLISAIEAALAIPTIDTAIAAWKDARTQGDRDLAAEAIEQHIAHDTPEGGDYEAATDELLARLKAEFGPVPVEDLRDEVPSDTWSFTL